MNKNKFFYTFALLLAASILFTSCRDNDDNGNGNGNNNPGIGNPTATTDPGVVINDIRWATRNVAAPGTFAQNATDAGMFFQWNRRTGWSATNPMVSSPVGATWDNTHATGETWVRTNDPCPPGWRVPTETQLRSLNNAGSVWTQRNGVNGSLFGTAPNQLFLPAAGNRTTNGTLYWVGAIGYYWSSSPSTSTTAAMYLRIQQGSSLVSPRPSCRGLSVRCVAE